jgi:hypothetical protein
MSEVLERDETAGDMDTAGGHVDVAEREWLDDVIVADSVCLHQAGVRRLEARQASLEQSGITIATADRIEINQGGIMLARGQEVAIKEGGAFLVAAEEAQVTGASVVLLAAREVSGDVRVLMDIKAAAVVGLVVGLVAGFVRLLAGRRPEQ